jgi:hypothetical protein
MPRKAKRKATKQKAAKPKTTNQNQSIYAGQSGSSEPGQDMNPRELVSDDVVQGSAAPQTIPIGIPISAQEYRRLKERAGKTKSKSGGDAQEDPDAQHQKE